MKKKLFFSVCLSLPLALFPLSAPAEEGSPLLSVDDLIALEDSYEAFLNELGDLAVQRGLLSEEDRAAWHDAQLGDYFQNGGYGSILSATCPARWAIRGKRTRCSAFLRRLTAAGWN